MNRCFIAIVLAIGAYGQAYATDADDTDPVTRLTHAQLEEIRHERASERADARRQGNYYNHLLVMQYYWDREAQRRAFVEAAGTPRIIVLPPSRQYDYRDYSPEYYQSRRYDWGQSQFNEVGPTF